MTVRVRPVIFSGEMVRRILDGTKSQTRRICRKAYDEFNEPAGAVHPDGAGTGWIAWWPGPVSAEETVRRYPGAEGFRCPFGLPGDHLYVRETWRARWTMPEDGRSANEDLGRPIGVLAEHTIYRADEEWHKGAGWKPAIHMPRECSRILLEITAVRVERLQAIGTEDIKAEGIWSTEPLTHSQYRQRFHAVWDAINRKRAPWAKNPWVWAITFKRLKP